MKIKLTYFLFVLVEMGLVSIIIILGIKIMNLISKNWLKKTSYVTILDRRNYDIDSDNKELIYFYEPKSHTTIHENPEWLGYDVQYSINSDSLNERFDYSTQVVQGIFRIITLGDSFTFGEYVNTSDNYSELLEDLLNKQIKCLGINKFEVINLGVSGYDVEYSIERFLKRGRKYNPNLIIWLIGNGNLLKINEYTVPLEKQLIMDGSAPKFDPKSGKYTAIHIASRIINNQLGEKRLFDYQKTIFKKFADSYKDKLIITTFPNINENIKKIISDFVDSNRNYQYYNKLLLNDFNNGNLFLKDGHPNKMGHNRIALDIFSYLYDNQFNSICSSLY